MNRLCHFVFSGLMASLSLNSSAQTVWTERGQLPTTSKLNSLIWTGTQLVAAGDYGAVLTSRDGVSWTRKRTGILKTFYSLAWTGTQLVATWGANSILTSPDGSVWTERRTGSGSEL